MILTIDIGNTTIAVACVAVSPDGEYSLRYSGKLETMPTCEEEDYEPGLKALLDRWGVSHSDFRGAVISSVVPAVRSAMEACVRTLLHTEPVIVTYESDLGITLDVDYPEKVGCDRLVDSAWAAAHYPLPVVTADLGTASTLNVIRRGKVFSGGIIAAGIMTGLRALASGTAQLPEVELSTPGRLIGKNTMECMISGAVVGTAAFLDGVVERIEEELGQKVSLVITGGGGEYVAPLVKHSHVYDPELILKGLAYLYMRNR